MSHPGLTDEQLLKLEAEHLTRKKWTNRIAVLLALLAVVLTWQFGPSGGIWTALAAFIFAAVGVWSGLMARSARRLMHM